MGFVPWQAFLTIGGCIIWGYGKAIASGRIDNAFGDRNFICSCQPMEAYT